MAISNKDVEVLSEALFCYYFAIYKNKKEKDYNFAVWNRIKNQTDLTSFTNKFGITSMVKNVNNDPAFVKKRGASSQQHRRDAKQSAVKKETEAI